MRAKSHMGCPLNFEKKISAKNVSHLLHVFIKFFGGKRIFLYFFSEVIEQQVTPHGTCSLVPQVLLKF